MANKRFVKPVRPDITIPAIRDAETIRTNSEALYRDEYRYTLAESRRRHPDWTLAQRQEHARASASSLFE